MFTGAALRKIFFVVIRLRLNVAQCLAGYLRHLFALMEERSGNALNARCFLGRDIAGMLSAGRAANGEALMRGIVYRVRGAAARELALRHFFAASRGEVHCLIYPFLSLGALAKDGRGRFLGFDPVYLD